MNDPQGPSGLFNEEGLFFLPVADDGWMPHHENSTISTEYLGLVVAVVVGGVGRKIFFLITLVGRTRRVGPRSVRREEKSCSETWYGGGAGRPSLNVLFPAVSSRADSVGSQPRRLSMWHTGTHT
jgi:hypothetical protein